jgi:hypothetical protein
MVNHSFGELQDRTFCRRGHLKSAMAREGTACHLVGLMSREAYVDE